VIALLAARDPAYVREAAKRGVFAYIVDTAPRTCKARSTSHCNASPNTTVCKGAFGRRAVIEQAKGILIARYVIDSDKAFEMLRDHSQHNGRELAEVAEAIVESHRLLVPTLATVASPKTLENTCKAWRAQPTKARDERCENWISGSEGVEGVEVGFERQHPLERSAHLTGLASIRSPALPKVT
jgi:hypothetical protein